MKYSISLFSFLLTLIFLEICVRTFVDNGMNYEIEMMKYANNFKKVSSNKKIGIEHQKNLSGKLMGADIFLDKNGFRKNSKIKKNSKKIIMLGDSMTFGWGANKTFSHILNERILTHEVFNAGIGNTNTIMQINNFFENFSKEYAYDMVVLNFFINDFENVLVKEPNFFQKYSYFYTFLNNKINIILIKLKMKKDWKNFYSENYLNNEIKNLTLALINNLNKFCLDNDMQFVIHNIPELRDLKNYKFNKETKIISEFAKTKNIKFINSYDVLKKYEEKSLWVTDLDPHANDRAHRIISEFLFDNLNNYLN